MRKLFALSLCLLTIVAHPLVGQDTVSAPAPSPSPSNPTITLDHAQWGGAFTHYGKWAAAALAATFTALGAHEHANSNRAFNQLLDACRANAADCALKSDGTYLNASSEGLYQTAAHFDSRARLRLLLGQASLLFSAGLFLADLRHHARGPGNIPFHPAELIVDGSHLGLRVGL